MFHNRPRTQNKQLKPKGAPKQQNTTVTEAGAKPAPRRCQQGNQKFRLLFENQSKFFESKIKKIPLVEKIGTIAPFAS